MRNRIILALSSIIACTHVVAAEIDEFARVLEVSERTTQVKHPRRECAHESAAAQAGDERGYAGAVIGGIAGGLLGNQVGKGNGKVAATGAGAVAGALVGDRVQNSGGSAQPATRCYTTNDTQTKVTGYYVTYEFRGQTFTDVVPFRPGEQIRIRARLTPAPY